MEKEEIKELENMVSAFLVSELKAVLRVEHRSVCGRKTELQTRVRELLHSRGIQLKICEIYKAKFMHLFRADQLAGIDRKMNTTRQICRQLLSQSAVSSGKELPPVPTPRTNPMHQTTGYTIVTPQQTTSATNGPYSYIPKVLPPPLQVEPKCQYPVHPDVKFKKLPFYDLLAELLKPSSLMPLGIMRSQENTFMFHLTPQQTDTARSWDCQVQIRFCLQETSCEQEDCFPPRPTVRVNGHLCLLPYTNIPGVGLVTLPRHLLNSASVKKSLTVANHIQVRWLADCERRYAVAVYLVRKLSSAKLLSRLKSRGVRHSDYTRGLIKEKLNEDANSEIATTSLKVSLACPLGKTRMVTPCRASTCSHLQCFDASLFLRMNEKTSKWICPFCDKPALYDTLVIDGYFQEVLNSKKLLPDENTIQLLPDGSWENLVLSDKDTIEKKVRITNSQDCNIDMDTTVDLDESIPTPSKENKRADVIDLISDNDDDDKHSTPTQSTKKLACGTSLPKNLQTSSISHSLEFLFLDLD